MSEQPKPYHPQERFGSGVQPAALAYPHLAAYYGDGFMATFTTLDLLDSLAQRVKLAEEMLNALHADEAAGQVAGMMAEGMQSIIDALNGAQPAAAIKKMPWRLRLLYRLLGRSAGKVGKYPQ